MGFFLSPTQRVGFKIRAQPDPTDTLIKIDVLGKGHLALFHRGKRINESYTNNIIEGLEPLIP